MLVIVIKDQYLSTPAKTNDLPQQMWKGEDSNRSSNPLVKNVIFFFLPHTLLPTGITLKSKLTHLDFAVSSVLVASSCSRSYMFSSHWPGNMKYVSALHKMIT